MKVHEPRSSTDTQTPRCRSASTLIRTFSRSRRIKQHHVEAVHGLWRRGTESVSSIASPASLVPELSGRSRHVNHPLYLRIREASQRVSSGVELTLQRPIRRHCPLSLFHRFDLLPPYRRQDRTGVHKMISRSEIALSHRTCIIMQRRDEADVHVRL